MKYNTERLQELIKEAGSIYRLSNITKVGYQTLYMWAKHGVVPHEKGVPWRRVKPYFEGTKEVRDD